MVTVVAVGVAFTVFMCRRRCADVKFTKVRVSEPEILLETHDPDENESGSESAKEVDTFLTKFEPQV